MRGLVGYAVVVVLAAAGFAAAGAADDVVWGGGERLLQGEVTSMACLREAKGYCALDQYDRDDVVLFTSTRKVFRLEPHRIPAWRLDQVFGQPVFVKGLVRGDSLLVNDVAGGEKTAISKSCL